MNGVKLTESLLEPPPTNKEAYQMGYDCGLNGPNEINSRFRLFARPELTEAWEQGKADAAAGK
jgi:hypothetical protein